MCHSRFFLAPPLALLLFLSACGGGGGGAGNSGEPSLASVRTLAYQVNHCRETAAAYSGQQTLQIRQGNSDPVSVDAATLTVMQEPPVLPGVCRLYGMSRLGFVAALAGGIQRLGVSPDGSAVVFEKTNRFSILGYPPLPPDEEGFFVVQADGSGLRQLGPASRESITRFAFGASYPNGFEIGYDPTPLSFSADGQTIVFSDRGPGPAGEDAAQVMTLDLETGTRRQVTRLPQAPPADPPDPLRRDVDSVRFLTDGRIWFVTFAYGAAGGIFTVKPDGSDLTQFQEPIVQPGSVIDPNFEITSGQAWAWREDLPGGASEIFLSDPLGDDLQLTDFGRRDTNRGTIDIDGQRVYFLASADPLGHNPFENCQIFSIGVLGNDLQQLTEFSQGGNSTLGCGPGGGTAGGGGPLPGCISREPRQEPTNRALVFASSCDPLVGDNPNGEQVFAMYPDGTGLQQLTDARGFTTEADGTVDVELPGPFASTAVRR